MMSVSCAIVGIEKTSMNEAAMKYIEKADTGYPDGLKKYLGDDAPDRIAALGDTGILQKEMVAVFCSVRCPGDYILQAYDAVRELRDAGVAVVGGFHSPMSRNAWTCFCVAGSRWWCVLHAVLKKTPL